MTLSKQLEELERQREEAVRGLHFTYLRTKREARRTLHPGRFVRKHMILALAAGAAVGMLLAPRPAPKAPSEAAVERAVRKAHRRSRRGGAMRRWARHVLARYIPHAATFIPEVKGDSEAEGKIREEVERVRSDLKGDGHKKPGWAMASVLRMLEAIVPMIASRVDWRGLVNQARQGMHKKGSQNGHEPKVAVADAGTVKPHDYENFE
jgi:hypothetical protein